VVMRGSRRPVERDLGLKGPLGMPRRLWHALKVLGRSGAVLVGLASLTAAGAVLLLSQTVVGRAFVADRIEGLLAARPFDYVIGSVHFVGEASQLRIALKASLRKIIVFLGAVLAIVVIVGSIMYLIEGEDHGFSNIPVSIYWAIVTMTTVGYGDIAPQTPLGKMLASIIMILGYGIIAVPTGIVSVELAGAARMTTTGRACPGCGETGHDADARHCKHCGAGLG